ncbi:MAG: hypothetical protein Tsb0032_14570 [Kiloniellaceae bacterium]
MFALFVFAGYYKAADVLGFLPVDLTLLFWAASAGFCLWFLWQRRRLPLTVFAMATVFLLMAVGLHWPDNFAAYDVQKELRLFSLTALAAFAPFLLLEGERERRLFFYGVALLGLVMAALAVIELATTGSVLRLSVFNTNPILLARASCFAALVLCLLFWQRRIGALVFLPLAAMAVVASLASGSRGPLVALVATLAVVLPLAGYLGRSPIGRRGIALASIGGFAIALIYSHQISASIGRRFVRLFTGRWGDSEASRWSVWEQTAELIAESPLGIGWGRLGDWVKVYNDDLLLQHPHNIFLEIAAEAGLPAALVFALVIAWALAAIFRRALQGNTAEGETVPGDSLLLLAALTYWLGCAFFSGDVNDNRPMWAVLGMVLTALAVPKYASGDGGRRRVLHVSSAHRASDGRIARKEAAALSEAGYDVTVLALERAEGAVLPQGPRFIEYAAPASRLRRFLFRSPWLLGYCLRHRFDVYHLHDPDLILLGFALKLAGRRVVYDVHEAYPMVVLDRHWIPGPLRPMLSRLWRLAEGAFVRLADLTVAAHEPVAQQFRGGRVVTVHNYPIVRDLAAEAAPAMSARPWQVLYHGDLTEQRGLLTMVEAIGKTAVEPVPELRLGGSLTPAWEEKIAKMPGMARTRYLGWLDKEDLARELGQARVGLVLLHPTHNYRVIRPNKLYEYMAAGLPVVASDFPHWREVVEPANCGLLVDPLDTTAIARAVEYLLTHPEEAAAMGARGREAVAAHYNWQAEKSVLLTAYEGLFQAQPAAARHDGVTGRA